MHMRSFVTLLALSGLAVSSIGLAQSPDRINPMIALHERGLPVFGVTHPAIVAAGRRPGNAAGANAPVPAPLPSLADAARDTVAYRFSDFAYDNYSSATADRFRRLYGGDAGCRRIGTRACLHFKGANHPHGSCRRHRPHR